MEEAKYNELRARVLAQTPPRRSRSVMDDAPFSTYVRYGKRMVEYVAAGCEIDEAFLLTHEQYKVRRVRRERAVQIYEWRIENVADREWSEPPSQYVGAWQTRKREEGRELLASMGLPRGEVREDGQVLLFGDGHDHRW